MSVWTRILKELGNPTRLPGQGKRDRWFPEPPCTPPPPRDPEPVRPSDPGDTIWPDPGNPSRKRRRR